MASDVAGGGGVGGARSTTGQGVGDRSQTPENSECKPRMFIGLLPADLSNAFISQFRLEGSKEGPLAGRTLAVKDLFDVSGCVALR
jgi:hypothetical protein